MTCTHDTIRYFHSPTRPLRVCSACNRTWALHPDGWRMVRTCKARPEWHPNDFVLPIERTIQPHELGMAEAWGVWRSADTYGHHLGSRREFCTIQDGREARS